MSTQQQPAGDFALVTEEPSIAFQIWTRIRKEPQLATNLTVEKIHGLREFSHLRKNVVSAAVSDLYGRGFFSQVDKVGQSNVYGPGPAFSDPTIKFRHRVVGGHRDRKSGYKVERNSKPGFQLSGQAGLDLGPNFARDEAKAKRMKIIMAMPENDVAEALALMRAARAKTS